MKDFSQRMIGLLTEARNALANPHLAASGAIDVEALIARLDGASDHLRGESLSWVTFRERSMRGAALLDESAATSKQGRLELAKDLHALVNHGRLPDEISAETRHAEVLEELRRIRKETALLTAHTIECTWEEREGRREQPSKCAFHPTHKWFYYLCPAHRAYLGYGKDERFTPPLWIFDPSKQQ